MQLFIIVVYCNINFKIMNKEELEKHKVITAHFMAITNHIESLENKNYAYKLMQWVNRLKNFASKITKQLFRSLDEEHIETYDEWANFMADIMVVSEKIGYDKAYALLKTYESGDVLEVDGENQAVKNQLTYLKNFSE